MAMAARTEEQVRRKSPAMQSAVPYLTTTAVPKPRYRELPEERPAAPQRKPKQKARPRVHLHPISSGFTIVCLLTAAFLILLVISGSVQLYEATSEVADLNDELAAAQQTQTTLQNQFESKIDLDYVEQVATTQLGMLQPAPNQVVYLDLCEPDHAEIVKTEQAQRSGGVFSALRDGVTGMIGYFREYFS